MEILGVAYRKSYENNIDKTILIYKVDSSIDNCGASFSKYWYVDPIGSKCMAELLS